jgi:hypothetical protein
MRYDLTALLRYVLFLWILPLWRDMVPAGDAALFYSDQPPYFEVV